ncbi:hypothetical protein BGZ57DRAFT_612384 [Hyaloscypha finlandica]|nr:hypothetical protein BGZ57DRAFT_612384 [Hyaloscypha finlandica]
MDEDLEVLSRFYAGNEWASDRPWSEDEDKDCKRMDYYFGSYAVQFRQCIYVKHAADINLSAFKYSNREQDNFPWTFGGILIEIVSNFERL